MLGSSPREKEKRKGEERRSPRHKVSTLGGGGEIEYAASEDASGADRAEKGGEIVQEPKIPLVEQKRFQSPSSLSRVLHC